MTVVPPRPPKPWERMTPRERAEARTQVQVQAQERRKARDVQMMEDLAADIRRRHEAAKLARSAGPFLDAFEALCREHGISIEHEDRHGAFMLVPFNPFAITWMRQSVAIAAEWTGDATPAPVTAEGSQAEPTYTLEGGPW